MLHLLFKNDKKLVEKLCGKKIIEDVELEFIKITDDFNERDAELIKAIDKGTYNGGRYFIDRFGLKCDVSYLSTGCKTGICINHINDSVIPLMECGTEAFQKVLSICKSGYALCDYDMFCFYDFYVGDEDIEIELDGYVFTRCDTINDYIRNKRGLYEPDFTMGGVTAYVENK